MFPLIGITTNESADYGASLRRQYYQALTRAGALPVALPPLAPDAAGPLLRRLDGLLLAGGADIAPQHYGEAPLPEAGPAEAGRDLWELALARKAWQMRMPVLAICRGLQLLNVALGGTLWQDTRYPPGLSLPHQQQEPPEQATQAVRLTAPALTELAGAAGITVNSLHHQALRRLSHSLHAAAFAADGLIEAVLPAPPYAGFCLGVQWHPERLDDKESRRIFAAFVAAAQDYSAAPRNIE
jgi:putative glutamine amidotransferase